MRLPDSALLKLAAEFRAANSHTVPALNNSHTLPIRRDTWNAYAQPLDALIKEFAGTLTEGDGIYARFKAIQSWLERITELRRQLTSMVLTLMPFEYFSDKRATRLLRWAELAVEEVATAAEKGRHFQAEAAVAERFKDSWCVRPDESERSPLEEAFGLDFEPLNKDREFQAADVFNAYAYRNSQLVNQVLPHLASLGVPATTMANDMLVGVVVVGRIAGAEDPVAAAVALHQMFASLLHPAAPQVVEYVLKMFTERENITLQVRRRVASVLATMPLAEDLELRALALADAYKSLAEGSIRHFGWAMYCLETGSWSKPPMLARVRDSLVAHGGFAGRVAETCIITNLRNGEAHESLEWDGVQGCYLAEGDAILVGQVVQAVAMADSFDKGCEAALACYRALRLTPQPGMENDPLRMAARERVHACFGTNGLQVVWADFNSSAAQIRLSRLRERDINPCFQAMLVARQLLPRVASFEVSVEGEAGVAVGVDAGALDDTLRVWSEARESFDKMPLVAFLPANLAARSRLEPETVAVRSVTWIAADDLLSAIDGADELLDADSAVLMSKRSRLVETAVAQCMHRIPVKLQARPMAVLKVARELQQELSTLPLPTRRARLDQLGCVVRLRYFWTTWGPVLRLPKVEDPLDTTIGYEEQPKLLDSLGHSYWQTL